MEKQKTRGETRNSVSFVRKPAKQGDAYSFTIPKALIDAGLVIPNKTYHIVIEPIEELEIQKEDINVEVINGKLQVTFSERIRSRLNEQDTDNAPIEKAINNAIQQYMRKRKQKEKA